MGRRREARSLASDDLPARAHQSIVTDSRLAPWDGPYYWERSVYTKHDRIEVPVLHFGGWFDGFSRGTLHNFQGVASKHNRMIMQPCTHKGCGAPFDPASDYTEAGLPPGMPEDPILAWFDRFLKGEKNGIDKGPAASYYDLGDREWKSSRQWPPEDSQRLVLKLSGEPSGTAASVEDGSLTTEPPPEASRPSGRTATSTTRASGPPRPHRSGGRWRSAPMRVSTNVQTRLAP